MCVHMYLLLQLLLMQLRDIAWADYPLSDTVFDLVGLTQVNRNLKNVLVMQH